MKVAIIGGGAAGMMCAATIKEFNPETEVFLVERNNALGKKVIISGGGRCNVTTGLEEIREVLSKYPRGGKFLTSAMYNFPPAAVKDWFIDRKVPLKCEKDLRVFPVSNQGKDIVAVFEKIFNELEVKVLFNHFVKKIEKAKTGFKIYFKDQAELVVDKVVLACGGQAYRHTGSTGDGYHLAESLGHHISELAPSLSSLTSDETWPSELAGVSFVKAAFKATGKNNYHFTGPFVFTHWGISGPAVFALSSQIAFEEIDEQHPFQIYIDLLPDWPLVEVVAKLKKFTISEPKKFFKFAVHSWLPLSVSVIAVKQSNINPEKKNFEISRSELQRTAEWLKKVPLAIIGRKPGDEFVTAGGIELSEVDPQTMESKICPGLFLVGEILNVDGYTGGFNLQASWATGCLAGQKLTR